jgi:hypothetical protein
MILFVPNGTQKIQQEKKILNLIYYKIKCSIYIFFTLIKKFPSLHKILKCYNLKIKKIEKFIFFNENYII